MFASCTRRAGKLEEAGRAPGEERAGLEAEKGEAAALAGTAAGLEGAELGEKAAAAGLEGAVAAAGASAPRG